MEKITEYFQTFVSVVSIIFGLVFLVSSKGIEYASGWAIMFGVIAVIIHIITDDDDIPPSEGQIIAS